MNAHILKAVDTTYLDQLFSYPAIKPVPAKELLRVPQNDLSVWCLLRGIYQVPTTELIAFLESELNDPQRAIEIGAGAGQIGRHLGIRMTDNKMQEWPNIRRYYEALGQPIIQYGQDVETEEAVTAVFKYEPQTVVGCWITEKYIDGKMDGNRYGVDENYILSMASVQKYILVGNQQVHHDKQIFKLPGWKTNWKAYYFPWLFSRSMARDQNTIWIFRGQGC